MDLIQYKECVQCVEIIVQMLRCKPGVETLPWVPGFQGLIGEVNMESFCCIVSLGDFCLACSCFLLGWPGISSTAKGPLQNKSAFSVSVWIQNKMLMSTCNRINMTGLHNSLHVCTYDLIWTKRGVRVGWVRVSRGRKGESRRVSAPCARD